MSYTSAKQILSEWEVDSVIDRKALDDSALQSPKLHAKYLNYYLIAKSEKNLLTKTYTEKFETYRKWFSGELSQTEMDKLRFPYDPWNGKIRPVKSQFEKLILEIPEISYLKYQIDDVSLSEEIAKEIVSHINWRHTSIKAAIDFMKFQAEM